MKIVVLLAVLLVVGAQDSRSVRLTWYLPTGNAMANGQMPYSGAAACSWDLPLGTRLRFADGAEFTCADRGMLGSSGWVDLYAPTAAVGREYARRYGDRAWVEVLW